MSFEVHLDFNILNSTSTTCQLITAAHRDALTPELTETSSLDCWQADPTDRKRLFSGPNRPAMLGLLPTLGAVAADSWLLSGLTRQHNDWLPCFPTPLWLLCFDMGHKWTNCRFGRHYGTVARSPVVAPHFRPECPWSAPVCVSHVAVT